MQYVSMTNIFKNSEQRFIKLEEVIFATFCELFYLQSFKKYLRQTLVFMRNSALREKFHFYFSEVFG